MATASFWKAAASTSTAGLLLTTEECLLSKRQQRNHGFTREDYAHVFRSYLGVTQVLWLKMESPATIPTAMWTT